MLLSFPPTCTSLLPQKTYKYGCDLLSAAQRSRKASRLEEEDNAALLADLSSLWGALSGALVEARARLEVAQQFHHIADEVPHTCRCIVGDRRGAQEVPPPPSSPP